MDNRFLLSDNLGEVDSYFLDEYYENRRRRAVRRSSIVKYSGMVAAVAVVITLSLTVMLSTFRASPTSDPADTLNVTLDNTENESVGGESSVPETDNNKFNKEEHTKPNYNDYTVIYAEEKDDSLGDIVEDEVYIEPPKSGEVRFSGELYDIIKSDELYENTLLAVEMSLHMEFVESEEYKQIKAEAQRKSDMMWERYNNEFLPHIKTHLHTQGTMDWNCDECLRLHKLHETDESDIDNMNREADIILETDHEAHVQKVKERAEVYKASLGLEFKNVKVIWSDDPQKVDEFTTVWDVRFAYLTKEQIASFDASDDIGVELKLIPRWMDAGEDVIYRSQDFYPVTIE